jgi:HAD superfamily hydrolase (TIGR01549 family)
VTRAYRVVLFDLFGTVVHFVAPPPGAPRGTYDWLRAPLAERRPAIPFEDFRRALLEVSAAISAERSPEHREIPSRERFRRALARCEPTPDAATAEALSLAHMAHLAAQTAMPEAHLPLLRALAGRYRLGLVSNFDHAPTAQAILARHGAHRCFDVTLISDDFGRRKPHPSIFHEALTRLGAASDEALYVGDSAADDVAGAQGVGVDVAWINRDDGPRPDPPPTHRLRNLTDLRAILEIPPP